MRVSIEMPIKIRCGIGAEEGNSSVSSSYVLDRKISTKWNLSEWIF